MKKKNIAGSIVVIAIAVAVMFSGCVEKELGSIGGDPAINNPEDVVKAYFYYVNEGDAERAMNLLLKSGLGGTAPFPNAKIKEELERYNDKERQSWLVTTFENLEITDVTFIPQLDEYVIDFAVTEKSVVKKYKKTDTEDKECWCIVVETEDGYRILANMLYYPWGAFHEGKSPVK